ncbi:hypothetical protein Tco_1397770 [Tanacetum coccineum]
MTWAQFGKKRDKNATLQDFDEALDLQCVVTASQSPLTPSKIEGDDITTICDDVKFPRLFALELDKEIVVANKIGASSVSASFRASYVF